MDWLWGTDWIYDKGLGMTEVIIYQDSDPTKPHFFSRGLREPAAYIQFMIDYYYCLPQVRFEPFLSSTSCGSFDVNNVRTSEANASCYHFDNKAPHFTDCTLLVVIRNDALVLAMLACA